MSGIIKYIGEHFDKNVAFKTFVGRKSERVMGEFIESVGVKVICQYIEAGKMVTDGIPMEQKLKWKSQLEPWKNTFDIFTDHDLYNWIPLKYRSYFEEKYGAVYSRYMDKQCEVIRDFLTH